MISQTMVEEIRRLLEAGKLSQRAISKQLGVSRGTITSVSMNRRREPRPREEEEPLDQGPPARCASCGGMVYLPCRLCRTRSAKFGPSGERSLLKLGDRTPPPAKSGLGGRNEPRDPEHEARRTPRESHGSALDMSTRGRLARLPGHGTGFSGARRSG